MDRVRFVGDNGDRVYIDIESIVYAVRKGDILYCNRDFTCFSIDTLAFIGHVANRVEQELVAKSRILKDARREL